MEVGPTTHYVMGGIRVDSDTQMSTRARFVCRWRMRGGDQWRQSAGREFAFRSAGFWEARGRIRGEIRAGESLGEVDVQQVDETHAVRSGTIRARCQSSERGAYQVQKDLQEMMQDKVGIVRREDEMRQALEGISALWERAARVGVTGNREFNPGWHTALDLKEFAHRFGGGDKGGFGTKGKPRRAIPRRLSGKEPGVCAR